MISMVKVMNAYVSRYRRSLF